MWSGFKTGQILLFYMVLILGRIIVPSCYICLTLLLMHPSHFRFESYWADDEECEKIIQHAWQ